MSADSPPEPARQISQSQLYLKHWCLPDQEIKFEVVNPHSSFLCLINLQALEEGLHSPYRDSLLSVHFDDKHRQLLLTIEGSVESSPQRGIFECLVRGSRGYFGYCRCILYDKLMFISTNEYTVQVHYEGGRPNQELSLIEFEDSKGELIKYLKAGSSFFTALGPRKELKSESGEREQMIIRKKSFQARLSNLMDLRAIFAEDQVSHYNYNERSVRSSMLVIEKMEAEYRQCLEKMAKANNIAICLIDEELSDQYAISAYVENIDKIKTLLTGEVSVCKLMQTIRKSFQQIFQFFK